MRILALLSGIVCAVAMGLSLWERNFILAVANFNTMIWAALYAFRD